MVGPRPPDISMECLLMKEDHEFCVIYQIVTSLKHLTKRLFIHTYGRGATALLVARMRLAVVQANYCSSFQLIHVPHGNHAQSIASNGGQRKDHEFVSFFKLLQILNTSLGYLWLCLWYFSCSLLHDVSTQCTPVNTIRYLDSVDGWQPHPL